jgi:Zn-dependent M28 family amino/carboxypeptidase
LISSVASAQKLKKADKHTLANLQTHVQFLADDKLEGRRTGSAGEQIAYQYIENEFKKAGLTAVLPDGSYIQPFDVNDGKAVAPASHFIINGNDLALNREYFPLNLSANTSLEATTALALREKGGPWFLDLKEMLETNKNNPHFSLADGIKTEVEDIAKKGATGIIIYNSTSIDDELKFDAKSKEAAVNIPVLYIKKEAFSKYIKDETTTLDIKLKVQIEEKKRKGHNVVGYWNNNAATTIIIGAHFDHLGYGEDKNSMYTGTEPMIHNGADDNASGTAGMLELSKLLTKSKFRQNNYLFLAFSGEELGLFGSKYFTENSPIDLKTANYMVNLDMIGRVSDSAHGLTIGGYGTTPTWGELIAKTDKYFTIKIDSAGSGPSDHTSFYRKDIPVLFFFSGIHSDYHKPSDDADKINYLGQLQIVKYIYNLVGATEEKGKLTFTKTREAAATGKSSFKVSLGIMPDYTFSGTGVRADGVSDGKVAQRVGIKAGDIILQLGDIPFTDVQSYMTALSKFKKGDATKVKVQRGTEIIYFDIVF